MVSSGAPGGQSAPWSASSTSCSLLLHILFSLQKMLVSQGSHQHKYYVPLGMSTRVQIKVQTAGHLTPSCANLHLAAFVHYSSSHYNLSVIILAKSAISLSLYVSLFTLSLLFWFMIQFIAGKKKRRRLGACKVYIQGEHIAVRMLSARSCNATHC